MQQSGDELKVSFEVSDGRSGEVIFADAITDDMANLFAVQERVALRVRELIASDGEVENRPGTIACDHIGQRCKQDH